MRIRTLKLKYMQSWSDSFFDSVNNYSQIVGLIALVLTLISAYLIYATSREQNNRATNRESASEKRADELQKKADEAIRKAQALEARQAPRTLTPEQALGIIQELMSDSSPKGIICFQVDSQSEDSFSYATSIAHALAKAGYNIDPNAGFISAGLGLDVTVRGPIPATVSAIVTALNHHGVRAVPISDSGPIMGRIALTPPGAVVIGIGKKSIENNQ
jgi:hypothetical protein